MSYWQLACKECGVTSSWAATTKDEVLFPRANGSTCHCCGSEIMSPTQAQGAAAILQFHRTHEGHTVEAVEC